MHKVCLLRISWVNSGPEASLGTGMHQERVGKLSVVRMAVKCQLPAITFLGSSEVTGPTSADASGFAHPHSSGYW